MHVGQTATITITLPIQKQGKKSSIKFDFRGTAKGIEAATGMTVDIIYSYPGRCEVPKVQAHVKQT